VPEFKLPDPGEGLVEATIMEWKVGVGDTVRTNDIVVEVETAKSLVELPIPWGGTVTALLAEVGQEVEVGTPIIAVDTGDGGGGSDGGTDVGQVTDAAGAAAGDLIPSPPAGTEAPKREAVLVGYGAMEAATTRRRRSRGAAEPEPQAPPQKVRSTPPVRKYAKDRGVDITEVRPGREDGVITRADVDAHLAGAGGPAAVVAAAPAAAPGIATDPAPAAATPGAGGPAGGAGPTAYQRPVLDRSGEREQRVDVKGVRRMTAQAMVSSAFTAPHVTEFITVDVTATMELVERLKTDRELRDVRVSPLLLLAKALCLAVRRNPGMNAVWDEEAQQIVQRNYVNLGIAAATPRGLVVPNIKDADLMDLRQLGEAMADLVATAKAGRTQPAAMSGGTITITNVGVFGVDTGTPIINPGESAIVAFGAIRRQPWVVGTGEDERIEPRWVTQLAVSFDHRLIDGALGSMFLADLAALLQDPGRALVWSTAGSS
jgi:2-oxoisovalerate dehydrogenase E2 component (dihydrolipoyl transacylase)